MVHSIPTIFVVSYAQIPLPRGAELPVTVLLEITSFEFDAIPLKLKPPPAFVAKFSEIVQF
jgi:hypothetical protein